MLDKYKRLQNDISLTAQRADESKYMRTQWYQVYPGHGNPNPIPVWEELTIWRLLAPGFLEKQYKLEAARAKQISDTVRRLYSIVAKDRRYVDATSLDDLIAVMHVLGVDDITYFTGVGHKEYSETMRESLQRDSYARRNFIRNVLIKGDNLSNVLPVVIRSSFSMHEDSSYRFTLPIVVKAIKKRNPKVELQVAKRLEASLLSFLGHYINVPAYSDRAREMTDSVVDSRLADAFENFYFTTVLDKNAVAKWRVNIQRILTGFIAATGIDGPTLQSSFSKDFAGIRERIPSLAKADDCEDLFNYIAKMNGAEKYEGYPEVLAMYEFMLAMASFSLQYHLNGIVESEIYEDATGRNVPGLPNPITPNWEGAGDKVGKEKFPLLPSSKLSPRSGKTTHTCSTGSPSGRA